MRLRRAWPGLVALTLLAGCGEPAAPRPPDVLLVVLDTTRADHLSAYGYPRATTPELDRLATEGMLYRQAYAQSPWTLPAMATILTGQPPHVHGAGRTGETLLPVRDGVPLLAERLKQRGYRTAAFVNVVFCGPPSRLDRGFEHYDYRPSSSSNVGSRDAAATTDAVLEWARTMDDDEPVFMLVHYFDPHLTYDPPGEHATRFDPEAGVIPQGFGSAEQVFDLRQGRLRLSPKERRALVARYDGELRFTDEQFGRLRRGLEALDRWERSLVVVVADHGEEFWDHGGFEHGHTHYRELLHVPLIVRRPEGPHGESDERVRQLDIVPTLLAAIDGTVAADLPGRPLGSGSRRFAVAEGSLWGGDLVSIRGDGGTLILERDSGRVRYFAPDDPMERDDGWTRRPPEAVELEGLARSLPSSEHLEGELWQPDEREREQLRALGYLR